MPDVELLQKVVCDAEQSTLVSRIIDHSTQATRRQYADDSVGVDAPRPEGQ